MTALAEGCPAALRPAAACGLRAGAACPRARSRARERPLPRPPVGAGDLHDPDDRAAQLHPLPHDAGIAGPGEPAQPERHHRAAAGRPGPLGPRQAADPGPARRLRQLDPAGRPGLLHEVPGPAGHPGDRRPLRAHDPAHRPRRADRDLPGPGPGGLHRLAERGAGRPDRQRAQPDPLLDAVLRDRHAAHHHLRGGPGLVPDLGDADGRGDVRGTGETSWATSCRTSRSRSPRSAWA